MGGAQRRGAGETHGPSGPCDRQISTTTLLAPRPSGGHARRPRLARRTGWILTGSPPSYRRRSATEASNQSSENTGHSSLVPIRPTHPPPSSATTIAATWRGAQGGRIWVWRRLMTSFGEVQRSLIFYKGKGVRKRQLPSRGRQSHDICPTCGEDLGILPPSAL